MAGNRRHQRKLSRRGLPAIQRLFRDADAPARRRIRRRHRQPPSALRRRRGAPERVRRSHPLLPLRDRRRGAPARGRGHAVFRHRGQQLSCGRLRPRCERAIWSATDRRIASATTMLRGDIETSAQRRADLLLGAADDALRGRTGGGESGARERFDAGPRQRRCRRPGPRARGDGGDDCPDQGGPGGCPRASRARASELRKDVGFLTRARRRRFVYYLEIRGRGVFLRASPIDVSDDRPRAAARSDGRDRAHVGDAERRRIVRLHPRPARHPARRRSAGCRPSSTIAARRFSICRRRCPIRGRRSSSTAAGREVVEILKRTRRTRVRAVHELREPAAGPSARVGRARRIRSWCRAARRDRRCCATSGPRPTRCCSRPSSFWQGVDVVGEALSCVIIDKLPFASPGDPITAARIEAINARRRHAFGEYQIPLAILALQQGLGRLIRHRQDRGVLADPRSRGCGRWGTGAVSGVAAAGAGDARHRRDRSVLRSCLRPHSRQRSAMRAYRS